MDVAETRSFSNEFDHQIIHKDCVTEIQIFGYHLKEWSQTSWQLMFFIKMISKNPVEDQERI